MTKIWKRSQIKRKNIFNNFKQQQHMRLPSLPKMLFYGILAYFGWKTGFFAKAMDWLQGLFKKYPTNN